MKKALHKAENRGHGDYGWLTTNYSFSFADWYDPTRMGFGALRVINDDILAPNSGFGAHSHRDMEIITIVTKGTVTHKDSLGNTGTVPAGDVQVMSAGTGVTHSEYNNSPDEPLELFQIWIESKERNIQPRYDQRPFRFSSLEEGEMRLVDPYGKEGLMINQDAYITYAALQNTSLTYTLMDPSHGIYLFVIDGIVRVENETLSRRDALGLSGVTSTLLTGEGSSHVLIIEVPME
jgi:redox-sensitive bicupin YhaK (pirin superfamily)